MYFDFLRLENGVIFFRANNVSATTSAIFAGLHNDCRNPGGSFARTGFRHMETPAAKDRSMRMALRLSKLGTFAFVAIAGAMAPASALADFSGFGSFSGFTVNVNDTGNAPTVSSGTIHLINGGSEHRSIFYNTPQNISQFTASFTYVATYASAYYGSPGACFVLQNGPAGASSVATGADAYDGLPGKSLAVAFDVDSSSSGYFINGSLGNGSLSTSPVNLSSGDPINVTLSYDGSFLHESLLDTTTLASYSTSYLILTPFPTVLGGSTAYVGLTAGNGSYGDNQSFSNFQFTSGSVPEPASLGILSTGVIAMLMWRKVARR